MFGKSTTQKDLKAETLAKAIEMAYLGITEKHVKAKTKIQVRWLPPPFSWMKLNSDGSSMGNLGLVGGGGLICNENGEWVKGYTRAIGYATNVAAKLWALRDGIWLCISLKALGTKALGIKLWCVFNIVTERRTSVLMRWHVGEPL